jgi:predicted nuclease of predicted toxin-antitoxin system
MSRPRFLADHDLNEQIVTGVLRREPALECVRARDIGMSERLDAEVLAYAADNGFIVVSHDVNTMPSAAYARMSSGQKILRLLMVKHSDPVGVIIVCLILIWSASEAAEWENHVCFLPLH